MCIRAGEVAECLYCGTYVELDVIETLQVRRRLIEYLPYEDILRMTEAL